MYPGNKLKGLNVGPGNTRVTECVNSGRRGCEEANVHFPAGAPPRIEDNEFRAIGTIVDREQMIEEQPPEEEEDGQEEDGQEEERDDDQEERGQEDNGQDDGEDEQQPEGTNFEFILIIAFAILVAFLIFRTLRKRRRR